MALPTMEAPTVPAGATVEELSEIVGQLGKQVAYLTGQLNRVFVAEDRQAGDNFLRDHSFELLQTSGSIDANNTFALDTRYLGNYYWWNNTGAPRLKSWWQTGASLPEPRFGLQMAVVNNTNYLWQEIVVPERFANGPFCFSIHAAPRGNNTAGARLTCTLVITAEDDYGTLGTSERTFEITPSYSNADNGAWIRQAAAYEELPTGTRYLRFAVKSGSAEWIQVDGAQVVSGKQMLAYIPDNQVWMHARSAEGAGHAELHNYGTLTLERVSASGTWLYAYIEPVEDSGDIKMHIVAPNGIEFNSSSGGTVLYAVNAEGKNYTPWIQLQADATATTQAPGAIRYDSTWGLEVWDGSKWLTYTPSGYQLYL
ncbi:MAG: hypothetical protein ACYC5Y_16000 [Symbiobacteriia bacterium]